MGQDHSWKVNSRLTSQETPRLSLDPKPHYRVKKPWFLTRSWWIQFPIFYPSYSRYISLLSSSICLDFQEVQYL
jgi:hypothetical protein